MTKNAVTWIREDFRIEHNPALAYATQNHENVVALYIYNKADFDNKREAQKWWVCKSLEVFQYELSKYKINLQILEGDELEVFSKIKKNDDVSIYWNKIYEPDVIAKGKKIRDIFIKNEIEFKYFKRIPKIIIVEPDQADCVMQSIKSNKLKKIRIKKESIMGGMSCNEMSLVPWQILKSASDCCVSISDKNIAKTVAGLKDKKFSKTSITGGECAAPGVIALIGICNNIKAKKFLNLNETSNILIIGCEGNADVKLYKQLLSKGRK